MGDATQGAPASPVTSPIGRDREFDRAAAVLSRSAASEGVQSIILSGEPGIGKTRLTSAIAESARRRGWRVLAASCAPGIHAPFSLAEELFRDDDLHRLLHFGRPARIHHVLLLTPAGTVIDSVHRSPAGMRPDLFAGMVSAVTAFLRDSLDPAVRRVRTAAHAEPGPSDAPASTPEPAPAGTPSAGIVAYGDLRVLIESSPLATLVLVISGEETELLRAEMTEALDRICRRHQSQIPERDRDRGGDVAVSAAVRGVLERFLGSGKYDGIDEVTEPENRHRRLVANVTLGVGRLLRTSPVLLLADDLHCADPSSLNLLLHLLRNLRSGRLFLLGAYRAAEIEGSVGEEHPLQSFLRTLRELSELEEIPLSRLGPDSSAAILRREIGDLAAGPVGELLLRSGGGVPYLIVESVLMLKERGTIVPDGEGWQLAAPLDRIAVPEKVRDAILARVQGLPPIHRETLWRAAVLGEEFRPSDLAGILGTTPLIVHRALREIELRHGLVRSIEDGERYRFDHPLVRETVYESIPPDVRREAHARALAAMEAEEGKAEPSDRGLSMGRLARMAEHADAASLPDAGRYLRAAGDAARKEFQNAEAVRFYRRAVERSGAGDAADLLEALGETEYHAGRFAAALSWLARAREATADDGRLLLIDSRRARALAWLGRNDEALAELAAHVPGAGAPAAGVGRRLATLAWLHLRAGAYDEAARTAREALGLLADVPGATEEMADSWVVLAGVEYYRGRRVEAAAHLQEGLADARTRGNRLATIRLARNLCVIERTLGRIGSTIRLASESLRDAERLGSEIIAAHCLIDLGACHWMQGRPAEADDFLTEAIRRLGVMGASGVRSEARSFRAQCLADLGRTGEALTEAEEAMRDAAGHHQYLQFATASAAEVALTVGRPAEAEELARRVLATAGTGGPETARPAMGWAALLLGRSQIGREPPEVAVRTVADAFASSGSVLDAWDEARGLAGWGGALAASGDFAGAVEKLRSARAAFDALGATGEIRRVDAALVPIENENRGPAERRRAASGPGKE